MGYRLLVGIYNPLKASSLTYEHYQNRTLRSWVERLLGIKNFIARLTEKIERLGNK